jgi:hypothetical protein
MGVGKNQIDMSFLPNLQVWFEETLANRFHRHGISFFRLLFFVYLWSSITIIAHRNDV